MKEFFEQFEKDINVNKRQLQIWKSTINKIEKHYGSVKNWERSIELKYEYFEKHLLLDVKEIENNDSYIRVFTNDQDFIFEKKLTGIKKLKIQNRKILFFNEKSRKEINEELQK